MAFIQWLDEFLRLSRLTARIIIPTTIITLIALLSLVFFSLAVFETWESQVKNTAFALARIANRFVAEEQQSLARKIKIIADTEEIRQAIAKNNDDLLLSIVLENKLHEQINRIRIINRRGTVILDTVQLAADPYELSDENPIRFGLRELEGNFLEIEDDGTAFFTSYAHVALKAGDAIGVVAGSIPLDDAWASGIKRIIGAEFGLFIQDRALTPRKRDDPFSLLSRSETAKIFEGSPLLLDARIALTSYAVVYLPVTFPHPFSTPLYLGVGIPLTELIKSQKILRNIFFVISIIAFLLIIGIGYLVMRARVTKPLRRLALASVAVSAGDFQSHVPITSQDEIGFVAGMFNTMVEKLREAKLAQDRSNRLKSDFITVAAHQLRTPLTGVKWTMADIQEHASHNADMRANLKKSLQSLEYVFSILDEMLFIVETNVSGVRYRMEAYDIQSVLRELQNNFSVIAEQKHVVFICEFPEQYPRFHFNQKALLNALGRILDNAFRYTKTGGSVTMRFYVQAKDCIIEIVDTGIGILPEEQENLFIPFFRGYRAMHTETTGSGFGLVIAKTIIEAHGGSITIQSEKDKGTSVRIILPISLG